MRDGQGRNGGDSVSTPSTGAGGGAAPAVDGASEVLAARIGAAIDAAGGWIGFEAYMAMALYTPGLGYYARRSPKFGRLPASGSDFVTAPEMSPIFGELLARQLAQALAATGTREVLEFGAGSGALAEQVLTALDAAAEAEGRPQAEAPRYTIVELSATLRERQQARLAAWGTRVRWLDALPDGLEAVVVGNEVLDAMPVARLHWDGRQWFERGVARAPGHPVDGPAHFAWSDRPTARRPPLDGHFEPGTTVEIHPQSEAFVATLAGVLRRGAAFFIDYGFPQVEYYHPQRRDGTLMCHRAHHAEADEQASLAEPGTRDITAHVDFTAIALAGQDAGLDVIGYTSQARFLLNCGYAERLSRVTLPERIAAQPLFEEHEMGELFKVIGFARGAGFEPLGFVEGDRMHRL